MRKIITLLIILCITITNAMAYNFSISGNISDSYSAPIVNQKITIYSLMLYNPEVVTTDIDGNFSVQFMIPGSFFPEFYVQSWAWCNGTFNSHIQQVTGFNGTENIIFEFCQQNNVPNQCIADFQVEQITNHLLGFINTSRGNPDSIRWDLGDGTTITDENIIYEYQNHGLYSVCLDIYASNNCNDQTCDVIPVGSWEFAPGQVEMNNLNLPNGQLYIYQLTGNNKENVWTYKVDIEDGEFSIPYLLYNNYFIQAIPSFDISDPYFPKYLPTYFGQSLSWSQADSIDFSGPTPFLQIDLMSHDEIFFGHGSICGNLVRFDTVPDGSEPSWLTDNIIPPVTIFLLDESETTLDYAFFEESGSFCFLDIPYGNYILRTEKFRSSPFDVSISITEETPDENNIEIQVHESSIILNINSIFSNNNSVLIFPNPVEDNLNISFNEPISGQINIYDITGKTIYTKRYWGSNNVNINTKEFSSGLYFLKIEYDNGEILLNKFKK